MAVQRLVIAATILVFAARPYWVRTTKANRAVVVAKSNSPAATFSSRPANGNQFHALPENADSFPAIFWSACPAEF